MSHLRIVDVVFSVRACACVRGYASSNSANIRRSNLLRPINVAFVMKRRHLCRADGHRQGIGSTHVCGIWIDTHDHIDSRNMHDNDCHDPGLQGVPHSYASLI